ncbi:MAG: flagellar biosynthesis anti-sigma factor FlgM [Gammaproteobacteria bacterium]|nr:flagellar biosynthesis anti-sigma factor FlgM [Gammaproteobacteria bacterium]
MAVNNINGSAGAQIHALYGRVQGQSTSTEQQGTQHAASAPGSATADAVSFTSTAEQLRQAEKALANHPVVDSRRVDTIRDQIASGTFEINAPRIADKMIQMERMFGG